MKFSSAGQSILEIIVAMTVLVASMSAVIIVVFGNQSMAVDAQNAQNALYQARQRMEESRAAAKENFSALQSGSSTTPGGFTQIVTVTPVDAYTKKIGVRVEWKTDQLRTQNVELSAIVTDWKTAFQNNQDGGSGLRGDWTNPQTLESEDLGAGEEAQDVEIASTAVYMASTASDKKKDDFFAIDVANPREPDITARLNTGPGLRALSLSGMYVYAANDDSAAQLQIFDVSNALAPVFVKSVAMRNNTSRGRSVFADGNFVYIGSDQSSGGEFQIFDVRDPRNPVWVWSGVVNADVNDVFVRNGRAYLATSRSDAELIVFDVSNPSSPSRIGSFNSSDGAGLSVFVAGSIAFLGTNTSLLTLDVATPSAISRMGIFAAGGAVNDVFLRDYLAFLATANSNKEFQAVNITDPANPTLHSSLNFSQVATGITYRDNVVYMSVRSNDALQIITSTP